MTGTTERIEYKDYDDWLHEGVSADECAALSAGSIVAITILALLFHIHFVFVAKSFEGKTSVTKKEDSYGKEWDPT
jgi:hypothetical protein